MQNAPGEAEIHYHFARALERLGRADEAAGSFRHAIAINPDHLAALERLANLLTGHGRHDEARECYRRVAALQPDSLVGRISRAKVLADEGPPGELEAWLRETTRRFPTSAEAKRLLAMMLREAGRFDDAIAILEAATQDSPSEAAATAYYDLATSKKITAADAPMLEQMRTLLGSDALSETCHSRLHFGLGKALDDLEQYEEAMRHFEDGNRIAGRGQKFDRERFAASAARIIAGITPALFETLAPVGSVSELPVLIVGMPRSGTTLVEQILSSHRDVAAGGETNFWNGKIEAFADAKAAVASGDPAAWNAPRLAEDYLTLLRGIAPRAARVTDKTLSNFLWLGVIYMVFPKARIIHCRRHPVDTCLSNYFTLFREAMPFTTSKADLAFYYQQYARLMAHWRAVLPPHCFHEIEYEQLTATPEPVTRRLIDFCGLEWDEACLRPEANPRAVRTASAWRVRQPIDRRAIERWRRYEPWLGELRQLL